MTPLDRALLVQVELPLRQARGADRVTTIQWARMLANSEIEGLLHVNIRARASTVQRAGRRPPHGKGCLTDLRDWPNHSTAHLVRYV